MKNKKKWIAPKWAVQQVIRETGLVEDICEHGCGHPNREYLSTHKNANGIHGCDGCCMDDFCKGITDPCILPNTPEIK